MKRLVTLPLSLIFLVGCAAVAAKPDHSTFPNKLEVPLVLKAEGQYTYVVSPKVGFISPDNNWMVATSVIPLDSNSDGQPDYMAYGLSKDEYVAYMVDDRDNETRFYFLKKDGILVEWAGNRNIDKEPPPARKIRYNVKVQ